MSLHCIQPPLNVLSLQLGSEGFELKVDMASRLVRVIGASDRGLLFGVGRLLRSMTIDFDLSYVYTLTNHPTVHVGVSMRG